MICPDAHPPSFGLLLRQVRDGLVRQLDTSMAEENLGIGFTHYLGLKVLAARAPCTANELAQALDQVPSAVTRLLDKLEALIQHNESDIKTWIPLEYDLQMIYGNEQVKFSEYLTELRAKVREDSIQKIQKKGC